MIKEQLLYDNTEESVLLSLARTNTLPLNWRKRFQQNEEDRNTICPLCSEEEETLTHFLLLCQELMNIRRKYDYWEEINNKEMLRRMLECWKKINDKSIESTYLKTRTMNPCTSKFWSNWSRWMQYTPIGENPQALWNSICEKLGRYNELNN